MNILKSVLAFIVDLFTGAKRKKIEAVLTQVVNYASVALPIVEQIAKMPGNRTAAELIATVEHFGAPVQAGHLEFGAYQPVIVRYFP